MYVYDNNCIIFGHLLLLILFLMDLIAETSFAILCSRMSEYKLHTKELNVMFEDCVEWGCFFRVCICKSSALTRKRD